MRRGFVGLAVSLGAHLVLVGLVLGRAVFDGRSLAPRVDLTPITVEINELPLGAPPSAAPQTPTRAEGVVAPRRRPKPKVAKGAGAELARGDGGAPDGGAGDGGAGDAGAPASDAGRSRRGDLRAYGPEGSRVTALFRLDRLRDAPGAAGLIPAIDELLMLLPDRRRLLEGSGMDLYRDFDVLLIATPNPLDDAVTFLAARHRLTDEAITTALDRGAHAQGRPLTWRQEAGRPVGERRRPEGAPALRDDRLLLLPAPGLAVMAPPPYARLLLAGRGDGGAPGGGFRELAARIEAEGGAVAEDVVFAVTAANLLERAAKVPGAPPMPRYLSASVVLDPSPLIEVSAELPDEEAARAWEAAFPGWKQKATSNPLLLLGGFTGIVARTELERAGPTVFLRTTSTAEEIQRLLRAVSSMVRRPP